LTYTKTLKGKVYHVNNTIDSNKIIYLSPSVSEDENFAVVMAQSVYRQLLEKILDRCLTYTKTLKGKVYHVIKKSQLKLSTFLLQLQNIALLMVENQKMEKTKVKSCEGEHKWVMKFVISMVEGRK
jgi:hypothetical protein